jgi:hypothetical protein
LTATEAQAPRRGGEANVVLFVTGVALPALGRYADALISVGPGLVNALISRHAEVDRPPAHSRTSQRALCPQSTTSPARCRATRPSPGGRIRRAACASAD